MRVFINVKRNGYDPEECGRTLTAGELIELLSEVDEDTPIFIKNDNGYTYGSITEYDLEVEKNVQSRT